MAPSRQALLGPLGPLALLQPGPELGPRTRRIERVFGFLLVACGPRVGVLGFRFPVSWLWAGAGGRTVVLWGGRARPP